MATTERRELVERIRARDATTWTGVDEARRLGWLDEPPRMREDVDLLLTLADDVAATGCVVTHRIARANVENL